LVEPFGEQIPPPSGFGRTSGFRIQGRQLVASLERPNPFMKEYRSSREKKGYKALQPTTMAVTIRAAARLAPATVVADLDVGK